MRVPNTTTFPVTAGATDAVRIERAILAAAGEPFLTDWKAYEAGASPGSPMQDPEWLRGYFDGELDNISSYLFYDGEGLPCGSASFLVKDWPLKLHLGELSIGAMPLRRLRLLGATPTLPEDEALYDLLFRELLRTPGYDALHFSQTPVQSLFWRYLTTSPLIRSSFHCYQPSDESLRPLLRFGESFDEYLKTNFSGQHRWTLRRKVSRFREAAGAPVRLVRYTRPEEVAPFLDAAVQVSRKTYQWNLHQRGLSATNRIGKRYRFAAEHGWFRSYLLFAGETPCSFIAGYQWRGRYYIDEIGFDPALAKQSPGTVILTMTIEDLFGHDKPELIDFESYDKYKEQFSTESYKHGDLILFRRRPYLQCVRAAHYSCRVATRSAVSVLTRLNLKSKIKKALRNRSVNPNKRDQH